MGTLDKDILRFRSSIFQALTLRYSFMTLTCWAIAWGAVSLILRRCGWASPTQLLWGLVGIAPCVIIAIKLARRNLPKDPQIAAALDGANSAGGLMMARTETDIGRWDSTLPTRTQLTCRWQGRNWSLTLGAAVTFAIAMLLLPGGILAVSTPHALDVNRQVERLNKQIETLERERILPPEKTDTMQEKLDRLANNASGDDPVKTWESLDHIEKTVQDAAEEAAEKLNAQKDKLDSAQSLAEALAKASKEQKDSKALAEAMKSLSEMTQKACAENESVRESMKESLAKACKDGKLTQDQLDELAEAMKNGSSEGQDPGERELSQEQLEELSKALGDAGDGLSETLKELADAGMIGDMPPETPPEPGEGQGQGQGELVDFIEENQGEGSIEELVEAWKNKKPGRGGITRGRGDADMTWSKGTNAKDAKFKPHALPPAAVAALKQSKLKGVSLGKPGQPNAPGNDGSGALSGAVSGGGSAHTHVILPKHRGTVKRYFKRE